jgi:phosphatidate cytidylyltransferase
VLKARVLTAAIALPAVLAAILFLPPWSFSLLIGALGAWGLYEVATIAATRSPWSMLVVALAGGGPLVVMLVAGDGGFWMLPVAAIAAMLALVASVAARGAQAGPHGTILTLLGAAGVGVLFPYFAMARNQPGGAAALILMLLVVAATDSAAYFAGRGLGRVKLAPAVSPNKTVEGAVAGLLAGVGAGLILRPLLAARWGWAEMAGFAAAVSVLGQLGDLAGSALKRVFNVKDWGWVFPGHGGLLDRTSSLVFAVVFTYYYSR